MTATSLIDHIVANTPEKISDYVVIHTGISDNSLVYLKSGKFLSLQSNKKILLKLET